ncbi:MAG: molybdopterin converting factor subunit 1 [Pseudomonadota bacterium]
MRYFAWVRERIGRETETLDVPSDVKTGSDLIDWLAAQGEEYAFLEEHKLSVRVAVDQHLIDLHDDLNTPSEIAIFPPMTGG